MRPPLALAAVALLAAPTPLSAAEVVVFAAASLKNALDGVAAEFQKETGHTVRISYGGSNTLARQIVAGAPADIFVSASVEWMDAVQDGIVPGTRFDLLGNRLVLIARDPATRPVVLEPGTDLAAMLHGGRLAMAQVDAVPAGRYGKEALVRLGLWETVRESVAQTDNARAALALVAVGEAPLGIVYATDAAAEPAVHVVATFPPRLHAPITYPAALMRAAADPADRAFLKALSGSAAAAAFRSHGFAAPG